MKTASLAAALAALLAASPAGAAVGDWVDGGKARVRLIAAGVEGGRLDAGIEIELAPGWYTYWRNPGDAGIAPVFDFSGSRNLDKIDVAFPTPRRHDDGYSVTNIYEGSVILPLTATMADTGAGGALVLKLDIGVCAEVCIPDHFEATLTLDHAFADPKVGAVLKRARSLLPGPSEPGVFAVDRIWRDGGTDKRPVFAFAATLPETRGAELFVEGPADWYSDVPRLVSGEDGRAVYRFKVDRVVSRTSIAGARLRVTIVSAGRAVEQWIQLD